MSYISQLQGSLFCPHVKSPFWPSEAIFHSRTHSGQGLFSELFFMFSTISVPFFTTDVPDKWATIKFDDLNDFINVDFFRHPYKGI